VVLTELGSAAEVLVATGHDPYARGSLRRHVALGWVAEGATAWIGVDAEERVPYLSALGAPERVAALLSDLLPELPPKQRLSVPRGTAALLPAWVGIDGMTDWDFRWTATAPPVQRGEDLVTAGVADDAVAALLDAASPRASALPGDAAVRRWWGVADVRGRLLACAGDTSAATGVGHLSSIAVHPAERGRGLGKAVTAAAVRALLAEGCDLVTLGLYADNAAGRALYDALGLADEHRFTGGRLLQRSRW
jgi:ribosomal protein S18 acetylase RimI-like enzyme